jgi:zinc protease
MQVVVIPDRRAPVVTHMIWYKVGAADEPPGQSGIAHFLEHLMFKGTANFPDDTYSQTISRLGGTENAFTSYDYTAYFQRIAVEHLPLMMEMEADRMKNLVLSEEVVASERNVILEERASRVDNDPSALLRESFSATLLPEPSLWRPDHRLAARNGRPLARNGARFLRPLLHAGKCHPGDRWRRR